MNLFVRCKQLQNDKIKKFRVLWSNFLNRIFLCWLTYFLPPEIFCCRENLFKNSFFLSLDDMMSHIFMIMQQYEKVSILPIPRREEKILLLWVEYMKNRTMSKRKLIDSYRFCGTHNFSFYFLQNGKRFCIHFV